MSCRRALPAAPACRRCAAGVLRGIGAPPGAWRGCGGVSPRGGGGRGGVPLPRSPPPALPTPTTATPTAAGEEAIGARAYRVLFALVSLPLAIAAVVYFIDHRYDGVPLWNVR